MIARDLPTGLPEERVNGGGERKHTDSSTLGTLKKCFRRCLDALEDGYGTIS